MALCGPLEPSHAVRRFAIAACWFEAACRRSLPAKPSGIGAFAGRVVTANL